LRVLSEGRSMFYLTLRKRKLSPVPRKSCLCSTSPRDVILSSVSTAKDLSSGLAPSFFASNLSD
jgi:hypothetical protein